GLRYGLGFLGREQRRVALAASLQTTAKISLLALGTHLLGLFRAEIDRITIRRTSQASLEVTPMACGQHGFQLSFGQACRITGGRGGPAELAVSPADALRNPADLIRLQTADVTAREALQASLDVGIPLRSCRSRRFLRRAWRHDQEQTPGQGY